MRSLFLTLSLTIAAFAAFHEFHQATTASRAKTSKNLQLLDAEQKQRQLDHWSDQMRRGDLMASGAYSK